MAAIVKKISSLLFFILKKTCYSNSGFDITHLVASISVNTLYMVATQSPHWGAEERTPLNGHTCFDHRGCPHYIPHAGGFSSPCTSTLHPSLVCPLLSPPHHCFVDYSLSPCACAPPRWRFCLHHWLALAQPLVANNACAARGDHAFHRRPGDAPTY